MRAAGPKMLQGQPSEQIASSYQTQQAQGNILQFFKNNMSSEELPPEIRNPLVYDNGRWYFHY